MVIGHKPDYRAASEFIGGLHSLAARGYASRLFEYYRDYGTPRATAGPLPPAGLSGTQANRVSNTIRHYLVGDCDPQGYQLDSNGRRV